MRNVHFCFVLFANLDNKMKGKKKKDLLSPISNVTRRILPLSLKLFTSSSGSSGHSGEDGIGKLKVMNDSPSKSGQIQSKSVKFHDLEHEHVVNCATSPAGLAVTGDNESNQMDYSEEIDSDRKIPLHNSDMRVHPSRKYHLSESSQDDFGDSNDKGSGGSGKGSGGSGRDNDVVDIEDGNVHKSSSDKDPSIHIGVGIVGVGIESVPTIDESDNSQILTTSTLESFIPISAIDELMEDMRSYEVDGVRYKTLTASMKALSGKLFSLGGSHKNRKSVVLEELGVSDYDDVNDNDIDVGMGMGFIGEGGYLAARSAKHHRVEVMKSSKKAALQDK